MKYRSIAVLTLIATMGAAYAPVSAADCKNPRKAGTLSEPIYRQVDAAAKLMADKKFSGAIAKLKEITGKGSEYEQALVYLNLGFAYSSKDDYTGAADAFAKAIDLNVLPQDQHEQLQYNLGQIYIAAHKLDKGIATMQQYLADACKPPPADAHLFLANALVEAQRPKEALPQIELALSKAKQPKESWLQLKLAIQYELKDYGGSANTLIQLIGMSPDKANYWKQLANVLYESKQNTESLAALALAERAGLLKTPKEVDNLYYIYMGLQLPNKAGLLITRLMDAGVVPKDEKHLEMAANAWINASENEKAETQLKRLADMADKGEYYFRLGAMYGESERWKESADALTKAINKGKLSDPGGAWMRLAVAYFNLADANGARKALQSASTFGSTKKQAQQWLRHLGSIKTDSASTEPKA